MENDKMKSFLDTLYDDRKAYHGELHDHSSSGGTSDGKRCLLYWRAAMEALEMDFATILDHRQVRHMTLPAWDNETFIGGSEPGTRIKDVECESNAMHYNMVFSSPEPLMELLEEFEEFEFTGGYEGHFKYPQFTRERFGELIDTVKAKGGFFVIPHPKQTMKSERALDYYFRDETGIEVFYYSFDHPHTAENYKLWTSLLAQGKRVWACAGGDKHKCATDGSLTTVYAKNKKSSTLLSHIKKGDFTCGGVGIRMCIGEELMGGMTDFSGKSLSVSVGDFHKRYYEPGHRYRFDLLDDTGVVATLPFSCKEPFSFMLRTNPEAKFYRVEIIDETRGYRIAIGNPIWNQKFYS